MEKKQLKELEKQIVFLYKGPNSEDNRLAMREAILGIHELLCETKTVKGYSQIENTLDDSRGLLRLKYRDYVSLDFVPLPK